MRHRVTNPRKRLAHIIAESRQFITDTESWNDNRPNAPPMDCEPIRIVLRHATLAAELWDAGDIAGAQLEMDRLDKYTESVE